MANTTPRKNENLTIKNVRLVFKNFSGRGDKFNPEGKRNFAIVLTEEEAQRLKDLGWNVRSREPREPGDDWFHTLKVNVTFETKGRPPKVKMINGSKETFLTGDTIQNLDYMQIEDASVILRPYHYDEDNPEKKSAWLVELYVVTEFNELEDMYSVSSYDDGEDY